MGQITDVQMAVYRAAARRRQQQQQRKLELRLGQGWKVAQAAGHLLKQQFGAQRVVIFGSLLHPQRFHERSDVDLAVWGLDERVYYRAVSRLLDLEPAIPVDLVQVEFAPSNLLMVIESEGVPL